MPTIVKLLIISVLLTLVAPALAFLRHSIQEGSSTARILRSRGYLAKDHYVDVQGGEYTLNLVRATNPLINNGEAGLADKNPILFVHGVFQNGNSFFYFNDNVEPQNYSGHDIKSMNDNELRQLLKKDPGSQSLVFTALNFGYEVWLLNRRPTYISTRATREKKRTTRDDGNKNQTNTNRNNNYWRYSLDEQAKYDYPTIIDYVLEKTNKSQLIIVTFSAGGTITLMALSDKPELANKISRAILWATPFDFKYGFISGVVDTTLYGLTSLLGRLRLQLPPQPLNPLIDLYTTISCGNKLLRPIYCNSILNFITGKGAKQLEAQLLNMKNDWFETTATNELKQYWQSSKKGLMHKFEYNDRSVNLEVYGQSEPPIYNVSKITLDRIQFWFGNTDNAAKIINFKSTAERFTVPFEQNIIKGANILFEHASFLVHKNVTDLVIIPSLKTIALS